MLPEESNYVCVVFNPWSACSYSSLLLYLQMRIPTEHFAHVPVVLLSPSLLPSPEDEPSFPRSLMSRLVPDTVNHTFLLKALQSNMPQLQIFIRIVINCNLNNYKKDLAWARVIPMCVKGNKTLCIVNTLFIPQPMNLSEIIFFRNIYETDLP